MPTFLLTAAPFIRRYGKWVLIIIGVALLVWAHHSMVKRHYNEAFNTGYTKARQEAQDALNVANAVNEATNKANNEAIEGYQQTLRDRSQQRQEQERIIEDQIAPAIAAQPDCSIDPTIIAAINQLRREK